MNILYIIILVLLIVLIIGYVISKYNTIISYASKMDESFSTMDIYLNKRYDLIPNLVETIKGHTSHEQETLIKVIEARGKALSSNSTSERMQAEGEFTSAISKLISLTEAYPELKSNELFLSLQSDLKEIESEIANSRKYYNGVVKTYNTLCDRFPSNIIASIFKFEKQPMFTVSDESKRENVKVNFK